MIGSEGTVTALVGAPLRLHTFFLPPLLFKGVSTQNSKKGTAGKEAA